MSISKRIMERVAGCRLAQDFLQKNVELSQWLMGIGPGVDVYASGESSIFQALNERCRTPHVIFDVGANKGQFLQLALDNTQFNERQIHSFEPSLETYRILHERYGNTHGLKLNNFAIGQESGESILYSNETGSGLASLTKRKLDHFGIDFNHSEKIKVRTIDDYCREIDISRIHLLKLDIEGHELSALVGAKRMLAAGKVNLVAFEFGGCNIDTRTFFQDFWYFFRDQRMKIHRITPSGYLYAIASYREIYEQFRTSNFLAISETVGSGL